MPTGIDSISVVVDSSYLPDSKLEIILEEIKRAGARHGGSGEDIALIAIVGRECKIALELRRDHDGAGQSGININLLNQSINEMSIIIGVHNRDCHRTLRVIYELFVGDGSGAE